MMYLSRFKIIFNLQKSYHIIHYHFKFFTKFTITYLPTLDIISVKLVILKQVTHIFNQNLLENKSYQTSLETGN